MPAGLVAESEDDATALRRELVEETGYACAAVKFLCNGATSPGLTNERNSLYFALGLTPTEALGEQLPDVDGRIRRSEIRGLLEEGESIIVHEVPLADVMPWLARQEQRGAAIDLKVYAGLFFAAVSKTREPGAGG